MEVNRNLHARGIAGRACRKSPEAKGYAREAKSRGGIPPD